MPVGIYFSLLGRCQLDGREYEILRNGVTEQNPVEHIDLLWSEGDAERMSEYARKILPQAARFIETSGCELNNGAVTKAPAEFRRSRWGTTWHFCSNCARWPQRVVTIVSKFIPLDLELCNECVAKNRLGDCR